MLNLASSHVLQLVLSAASFSFPWKLNFYSVQPCANRKQVFVAGSPCRGDKWYKTAKSSLTISDFLINQNDISDLQRELVGLLGCVCPGDLHLGQGWGGREPGSVKPSQASITPSFILKMSTFPPWLRAAAAQPSPAALRAELFPADPTVPAAVTYWSCPCGARRCPGPAP